MTARWKWLLAIAGLLAANVVAMGILAVVAHRGGAQVIPDYYARAAHYDDELVSSSQSRALGWRVDVSVTGNAIDATVVDASGAPIDGAAVRITGYQRAHASDVVDVVLAATPGGHYRGMLPGRRGSYDLVARVEARGVRYTNRVVVEAR
ncbi:MAG TPA: FixH family protein [Kofleriaceae bacterium]|jgi:nitrogen fixation protein FixH|nr:FixH family protein [Kofleriaceae bacterium]